MDASSRRSSGKVVCSLAERSAACRGCAGGIGADHATLVREEAALPADALSYWLGSDSVRGIDSAGDSGSVSDRISALSAGSQNGINQVRSGGIG